MQALKTREKNYLIRLSHTILIFPVIKSPLSYSSKNSIVGEGTILMHGVILNSTP